MFHSFVSILIAFIITYVFPNGDINFALTFLRAKYMTQRVRATLLCYLK